MELELRNIKENQKKRTIFHYISMLFFILLALTTFFPPIRAINHFNFIWLICLLGWLICVNIDYPAFFLNQSFYQFIIFIYICYTVSISYIFGNSVIGNRFLELAQLPMFYIAYKHYSIIGRKKDHFRILASIFPFIIITLLLTIKGLLSNPLICRLIKSDAFGNSQMKLGIGGYWFIYFLAILYGILLFTIFQKNRKIKRFQKIILVLFFLLVLTCLIMSNYMTALILVVISSGFKLFLNKLNVIKIILFSLILLLILVFKNFILDIFFKIGFSLLGDSVNAHRLYEIKLLLTTDEIGGDTEARAGAYMESINLFLHNPLLGIIINPIQKVGSGVSGFGQHSQMFDTFALFGLTIGIIQIFIYLYPYYQRLSKDDLSKSSMPLLIMILLLFVTTMNNATPSIGFATFYIFPVLNDWLNYKI